MYLAKAVASFVLAVITGLVASDLAPFHGTVQAVMTIVSAVATAVVTYNVPYQPSPNSFK